ncbi:MAG: trypsin-like peptidase domain-containing protein [Oscillospiraceae bacterium]|nr:trypsin-like peptidase domain-containing protein [Oscillospiraceae bacterium]
MREWEPFNSNNDHEDPWNFRSSDAADRRTRRRPEQHDAEADHVIGSCDDGAPRHQSTPAPRPPQKRQSRGGKIFIIIIIIVAALAGMGTSLMELFSDLRHEEEPPTRYVDDSEFENSEEYPPDDFSYDIDPWAEGDDEDIQPADESTDEVQPSNIERYTGDAAFELTLSSNEGLTPLSYQDIYEALLPSVVTITVYNDYSGAYASGVILSEDGFILTNQHVTGGEDFAQVTTWDNVSYPALLVGEDPNSDLAVLKIEATGLTPAVFGDSAELRVGDESFAIGNPISVNYRGTFTNGIISTASRSVTMNGYPMTLIQTTTALNSGNSGGPLIDIYGHVVGIVNMKIMSSSITVEGLGFAIPSVTARKVANTLIASGEVEHPMIGITCYAVSTADPAGYGADGLMVASVMAGSDAEAQGVQVDDIITAVDGRQVRIVEDVTGYIREKHVGDEITVTIYREGEGLIDITFRLSEQNDLR